MRVRACGAEQNVETVRRVRVVDENVAAGFALADVLHAAFHGLQFFHASEHGLAVEASADRRG